eukprot:SAG31_NODE_2300_length_5980_cov_17.062744_6_plen_215_part_00
MGQGLLQGLRGSEKPVNPTAGPTRLGRRGFELSVRAVAFSFFVQLFEKYGTLIERSTAVIEKVSPCRLCPAVSCFEQLEDGRAALRWCAAAASCASGHHRESPVVALLGHSAGAHLASLLSLEVVMNKIDGVQLVGTVLVSGLYELDYYTHGYFGDLVQHSVLQGRPAAAASPTAMLQDWQKIQGKDSDRCCLSAAWLVVHGERDPLCPSVASQ